MPFIKDIYSRDIKAPNYTSTQLEVDDPLGDLIIKIENTLFTNRTEVLGAPEFGANLDDLVFSLVNNEDMIRSTVGQQINNYCLNTAENPFYVKVDVQFFMSEGRNGCYVDIIINDQRALGFLY
jgi:hypothetical protein